jgi:hypothetical protein
MIKYAESQKNVRPYLIGIGLIALAILVSWLVFQNPPAINPPANAGLSAEEPGSAVIDPADRKFYNVGQTVLPTTARGVATLAHVDPADRKFYARDYASGSGVSAGTNALTRVDPADRKFFTSGYVAGGSSTQARPLANVDPADRKFFTSGHAGDSR